MADGAASTPGDAAARLGVEWALDCRTWLLRVQDFEGQNLSLWRIRLDDSLDVILILLG